MASTTTNQIAGLNLLNLPPEIRVMVLSNLNNKRDFGSAREACRTLLNDSSKVFADRFLTKIKMVGTVAEVRCWDKVLRWSNLAQAISQVRELDICHPTLDDVPVCQNHVIWDSLPTLKRVLRLLNSIPDLRKFTLSPPHNGRGFDDFLYRREYEVLVKSQAIEPIFLCALGRMRPEACKLTCLTLDGIGFDGKHLLRILTAHSSSLRMVDLTSCTLTGTQENPVAWDLILFALHQFTTKLDELFLSSLVNPGAQKKLVLLERSRGNDYRQSWSSSNPLLRATPVNMQQTCHNTLDYNEIDAADYYAVFTRNTAHLNRSWVTKGLEILLGHANHTLYWDPCKPKGIPGRW